MIRYFSVILTLTFLVFSHNVSAQWFQHTFEVMGTESKVEFESSDPNKAQVLIEQVVAEMHRIDRLMSPFKADSELTLINSVAHKAPLKISQEMFMLLQKSLEFSKLTDGAFDISFSSVGYLYDYRKQQKPTKKQLAELTDAIDYRKIKLDPKTMSVYFSDSRVKIDLGGIAKGHAVDSCINILAKAGIKNAYVNAGGDSRLLGRKKDRPWYIGVKHPRDKNKLLVNLPLEEVSLSTSGDYERFFEQEGIRYHHIIDPSTGDSARAIFSATILADDSTTADALSTSIFVLGVTKGMQLVNSMQNVSAIMVDKHGKLFISQDLAAAE